LDINKLRDDFQRRLMHVQDRRRILAGLGAGAVMFTAPAIFAAQLTRTPRQTAGPFYPDRLPLDTDSDLLIINDASAQALGNVTWLSGRILDVTGQPVRSALVEIWQVDRNGAYLHTGSANRERRDANFQGYGRCITGSGGEYQFRTVKPVPYASRTAHIHFAVRHGGAERFTTQMYVDGEPLNERDRILNGIRDIEARRSVIVPFVPLAGATGELAARFDIVLGLTPEA
jgi:protocatechuate 3,4-dioxygenase, beta subunit